MFVRGTGLTQAFIWDESADEFAFIGTNDDHTVVGNVNISEYSNLRLNQISGSVSNFSEINTDWVDFSLSNQTNAIGRLAWNSDFNSLYLGLTGGNNPTSQIADTLANTTKKPVKAYVVSTDMSSHQALDRRTNRAATFSAG